MQGEYSLLQFEFLTQFAALQRASWGQPSYSGPTGLADGSGCICEERVSNGHFSSNGRFHSDRRYPD